VRGWADAGRLESEVIAKHFPCRCDTTKPHGSGRLPLKRLPSKPLRPTGASAGYSLRARGWRIAQRYRDAKWQTEPASGGPELNVAEV